MSEQMTPEKLEELLATYRHSIYTWERRAAKAAIRAGFASLSREWDEAQAAYDEDVYKGITFIFGDPTMKVKP